MNNSEKLNFIIEKLNKHDIYFQDIKNDINYLKNKVNKIEKRVDAIEHRVNSIEHRVNSIETRVSSIESKVSGIETRVSSIEKKISGIEKRNKELEGYRKRNNSSIELEITKCVYDFLQEHEKSLYIIDVSTLFPKKIKNTNNKIFIEIDGLILGTNDRNYAYKYDNRLKPLQHNFNISNNTSDKIYKLYIVEGKHNITKDKVIDKYNKYLKFKDFLDKINADYNNLPQNVKKVVEKYGLNKFKSSNIYLIFGTPMWNEEARQQVMTYKKQHKDKNIKIVSLSGNRYNVNL